MMPEISLNILDVAKNSVKAGASRIIIRIEEKDGWRTLSIIDKSSSDLPVIELPDGSVQLRYDLHGRPQPTIQPNQIQISPHQKSIHTP